MKKLLKVVIAFCLMLFSCSFFDKDVSCKAKLSLTIINASNFDKKIEFYNYKERYNPDYVTITYKDSLIKLLPKEKESFVFNYSWIGNNECFFIDVSFEDYRIDVIVKSENSFSEQFQVYPFDTTINMQDICINCVHEYSDTLIIE